MSTISHSRAKLLTEFLDKAIPYLAVSFWVLMFYYAFTQVMPRARFGILFLGSILLIYIIDEIGDEAADGNWVDVGLLALSAIPIAYTTYYMYTNFQLLYTVRVGFALDSELVMAGVFLAAMLYLVYRAFGMTFLAIVIVGIVYGLFGNYVPGILGHGGTDLSRMLQILVLDIEGFYGFLTRLTAAWIALFILFAGLLQGFGAFDSMIRVAVKASGLVKSGVAQSAVFGSMIIGSINGSTAANAAMTGSVTIPLMKRDGIKPESAGGIESVASTVGQVLPPVMGATAFVIAAFLSISYIEVLVAGLAPAFIMVVTITVGVHFMAIKQVSAGEIDSDMEEINSKTRFFVQNLQYLIPFLVLIYTLGIAQWTVLSSALYSCIALMVAGVVYRVAKPSSTSIEGARENLTIAVSDLVDGLVIGTRTLVPIAIILAAINGFVDILLFTGVPGSLSLALMALSGGILLIAAILAMIISIVLGMGMPTVAAYMIVATLIAPTLINQLGVEPLPAHFFVFYCSILAAITPPIATSVAVTTGIAQSNFWKTSFEAMKIAAPLFVLPFAFIYRPDLVVGEPLSKVVHTVPTLIGTITIIYGANVSPQRLLLDNYKVFVFRGVLIVLGIVTVIHPDLLLGLIGAAMAFAIVGVFTSTTRNALKTMKKQLRAAD